MRINVVPQISAVLVLGFVLRLSLSLFAAVPLGPQAFVYQGRLLEEGKPANGLYDLRFRLLTGEFEVTPDGSPMWTDTWSARALAAPTNGVVIEDVSISNGEFQVTIDFGPKVVFDGSVRFVELAVRPASSAGEFRSLDPPQRIARVPEAAHADTASSLSGTLPAERLPVVAARLDQAQTFNVAPLFSPAAGPPFQVGMTDTVRYLSADLLDGIDSKEFVRWQEENGARAIVMPEDKPLEIYLQATRALRLQIGAKNLGPTLIAGSPNNTAAPGVPGVLIGGGRGNSVKLSADYSLVSGGDGNEIGEGSRCSTVGGGTGQRIGPNSSFAGLFAGFGNVISSNARFAGVLVGGGGWIGAGSDFAAVVSGENNRVGPAGAYSAILSGAGNRIESGTSYSLIGSGQGNTITQAVLSAVVAGQLNRIESGAQGSFIGGGARNEIGPAAYNAVLGGGRRNQIQFNAPFSAILGGDGNMVRSNASWSAVLGGVGSIAGAQFTIAGGHNARAEHVGSIVLADGNYSEFASTRANEFSVRATGGVRLMSGERSDSGPVGVHLPPGAGAWSTLSDRGSKEDLRAVDSLEVLERLGALPITTWRYTTQDPSVRHMGPTAQDFKTAFGLGESEGYISTVDADGVALAAIQALNTVVREKDAEIRALKARLGAIEARLEQITYRR
jgi:hypothetical protein